MLAAHHEIRPSGFAPELRRQFPVHLLPPDLVTYTHIIAHCDDWMVVGEYADASARMYFLNRHSCTPIPYYTKIEAVRHIHSVHRLSDTQLAVSTGDKAKLFDLWDIDASGMRFAKRLMGRHGGFLSSARWASDDYFGTDFSYRPNYLYRYRDGKRWFFPRPAFTKYVLRLRAVDDRYLVTLNMGLLSLGGDQAWTVFDTHREVFIHAASAGKKAGAPYCAFPRSQSGIARRVSLFRRRRLLCRRSCQRVGHSHPGNRAREVSLPGNLGVAVRQDSPQQRAAVEKAHHQGNQQRHDPPFEDSGDDHKSDQPEDQSAGADRIGRRADEPEQQPAQQGHGEDDFPRPRWEPASNASRTTSGMVFAKR